MVHFFLTLYKSFLKKSYRPDELYPYAPSPGRPDLRQLWAKRQKLLNPLLKEASLSLPIVTSALTHAYL